MYDHILIPSDGSEISMKGVDHGLALARLAGAKVTIVTATEPFPSNTGFTGESFGFGKDILDAYEAQQAQNAKATLARARERAVAAGVAAETVHVPDAHAADAIVDAAVAHGCDLIVMSSHGRRGLQRFFLGSQASGVVNRSSVPVLVVR